MLAHQKELLGLVGDRGRYGVIPGVKIAGKVLEGMTCIRLDATVTLASSDKELAESNFKGVPVL